MSYKNSSYPRRKATCIYSSRQQTGRTSDVGKTFVTRPRSRPSPYEQDQDQDQDFEILLEQDQDQDQSSKTKTKTLFCDADKKLFSPYLSLLELFGRP